jgi:hypothetical protein
LFKASGGRHLLSDPCHHPCLQWLNQVEIAAVIWLRSAGKRFTAPPPATVLIWISVIPGLPRNHFRSRKQTHRSMVSHAKSSVLITSRVAPSQSLRRPNCIPIFAEQRVQTSLAP